VLFSIIDIHWVILSGIKKSIYSYLPVFSVAIFTSNVNIFSFWHCPKKKEKTLGKGQSTYPQNPPTPRPNGVIRADARLSLACAPVKQKVFTMSICFGHSA